MNISSSARFSALGVYLPPKRLTNFDLEKMVDTSDEWIRQRTGIKERRLAEKNVYTSDLAVLAVKNLAERSGIEIDDVDLIIVSTLTSDFLTPSTAARVQGTLGIRNAGVIDVNAACAGFVYGLGIANALITVGQHSKVIVIAADVLSKITDYTDRNTCVLFGDAAAAALVERNDEYPGFLAAHCTSDGELGEKLYCPGLSMTMNGRPTNPKKVLFQDGKAVYTWAISTVPDGMNQLLAKAGMTVDDLDWFIPHSANLRMVKSICKRLGIPMKKTLTSIEEFGNTSSVTIPLALDLAIKSGKIKRGDKLALYGFGGGLTQAGVIVEW
jgi:3-oxoacyl-[acyl-carrier-protein] synthase-3